MGHNPLEIAMGSTRSSVREVTEEVGAPLTFIAGLMVRRASTGALQLAAGSSAALIGVSLGSGFIDILKTAILRRGLGVPVLIEDDSVAASLVKSSLTFVAKDKGVAGNTISVEFLTGGSAGTEVVTVVGRKISVSMAGGVSTATQLKTRIDASAPAMALINPVTIAGGAGGTAQAAFAEALLTGGSAGEAHIVRGTVVKINTTTGKASASGTDTAATYARTGVHTGLYPDGTTARVAIVDLPAGL